MRKNYVASDKRGSDGNHKDRDHNRGRVRCKDKGAGGCRRRVSGKERKKQFDAFRACIYAHDNYRFSIDSNGHYGFYTFLRSC